MKRLNVRLAASVSVLLLASLACEFSFSSAKVENVRLAMDSEGAAPALSFGQQDPIFLVGDLANAPDDTKLKTTWLAVDVAGAAPETVIDEVELVTGSGTFNFSLEPGNSPWPPGKYRVDLYFNGELYQPFEYEVKQTIQPIVETLRLSQDAQGNKTTLSFSPEDPIYLVGNLLYSYGNSKIRVVWSALTAQGELAPGVVHQQEQALASGPFSFEFVSDLKSWPAGSYSVDLFLEDILVQTINFQVQSVESTGTVDLVKIYTARDSDGALETSVFAPGETFYVVADLINAAQGAEIEANWKAVEVQGFEPDEVISEPHVFDFTEGTFSISLANNDGEWPEGKYAVDLFVNGVFRYTHPFMVSSIKVLETYMAFDQAGARKTSIFGVNDPFYLLFKLQNAPENTKITTDWIQLGETAEQNNVLNESDYTFSSGDYYVELTSDTGTWLVGDYLVNLFVNDYLYTPVYFTVE
jgi:hypothetical protein